MSEALLSAGTDPDWYVHVDGRPIYDRVPLTANEAALLFTHLVNKGHPDHVIEIRRSGRHRCGREAE